MRRLVSLSVVMATVGILASRAVVSLVVVNPHWKSLLTGLVRTPVVGSIPVLDLGLVIAARNGAGGKSISLLEPSRLFFILFADILEAVARRDTAEQVARQGSESAISCMMEVSLWREENGIKREDLSDRQAKSRRG